MPIKQIAALKDHEGAKYLNDLLEDQGFVAEKILAFQFFFFS